MVKCENCQDEGWVCENHTDRPWNGANAHEGGCECGAGMPCEECNSSDYDNLPRPSPGTKTIWDYKNGWRH